MNRNVGTSQYTPDDFSGNFGRMIYENGVAQGKWYPEGAVRIESDPTGITDAFIGCAYDSQCAGFVSGGIAEAPAIYNGAKSGLSKAWNWTKGLFGAKNVAKIGDEIGNLGTLAENSKPVIDWGIARVHATNRMAQEGLSAQAVQGYVNNGKAILQGDGTILYLSQQGAVAIKNDIVQTVYSSNKFKEHILDVLIKLYGK